jgi:hypothetical protein
MELTGGVDNEEGDEGDEGDEVEVEGEEGEEGGEGAEDGEIEVEDGEVIAGTRSSRDKKAVANGEREGEVDTPTTVPLAEGGTPRDTVVDSPSVVHATIEGKATDVVMADNAVSQPGPSSPTKNARSPPSINLVTDSPAQPLRSTATRGTTTSTTSTLSVPTSPAQEAGSASSPPKRKRSRSPNLAPPTPARVTRSKSRSASPDPATANIPSPGSALTEEPPTPAPDADPEDDTTAPHNAIEATVRGDLGRQFGAVDGQPGEMAFVAKKTEPRGDEAGKGLFVDGGDGQGGEALREEPGNEESAMDVDAVGQ